MTPTFAQAVDPVYLSVLDLLDRIADGQHPAAHEERIRLRSLLDQAEALVGTGQEWELSKYALTAWMDEMLTNTTWNDANWWSNNVLEVDLFKTRSCFEQFYVKAHLAAALPTRNALEVFYVCVVLGFRGLYGDPNAAQMLTQSHGLPSDLETWAKQASMSIRLGQGRPPLPQPGRELMGAAPLRKKSRVVWPWLAASMLAATNAIYFLWERF